MPASASYQVYGIQEALAEINKIDRTLRRQITKDIQRGAGTRLVTAARSFIPTATPLSRMGNGNMIKGRDGTGWSRARVIAGIRSVVGKRGSLYPDLYDLATAVQTALRAATADLAWICEDGGNGFAVVLAA